MAPAQPPISGTRDYLGNEAAALRAAAAAVARAFKSFGYEYIEPPILEPATPFLDRSGEEIRRRMYVFADPSGNEVALRPELTIPACRAYLRSLGGASPEHPARLWYSGPAFRYEATRDGARQFQQAGVELIGTRDSAAADAEVLALALAALEAAGLSGITLTIGDLGIVTAFIDGLGLGDRAKARLRRIAFRGDAKPRPGNGNGGAGSDLGELADVLAAVEPARAARLLREVLTIADIRHVGGRTPEEIIERLIAQNSGVAADVPETVVAGLQALVRVSGKPETAFAEVARVFGRFGLAADAALAAMRERLRLFAAYREQAAPVTIDVGLRLGLEYYTGFVFEMAAGKSVVAGGGRYDNLFEALGAPQPTPAVGFGIGLDRLAAAISRDTEPAENLSDVVVVADQDIPTPTVIRIATALRAAGLAVLTVTATGASAVGRVPYVVALTEADLAAGKIRIQRAGVQKDELVALAELTAYAAKLRGTA